MIVILSSDATSEAWARENGYPFGYSKESTKPKAE